MKALFINSCIRGEESRTLYLANSFINKLKLKNPDLVINEVDLAKEDLKPLKYDDIKKRDELISKKAFNYKMFKYANEFKDNEIIIIATPFWDLSFPSILKVYFENIFVNNLTFKYENKEM